MMAQWLIIIGAGICGFLGAAHLYFTFFSNKLTAYDESVNAAMKSASPVISKQTTVWQAMIGFNASHSLGILCFAFIYIYLASSYWDVLLQSRTLLLLPVVFSLIYTVLAWKYWFNVPLIGISISAVCFMVAAVLVLAGAN